MWEIGKIGGDEVRSTRCIERERPPSRIPLFSYQSCLTPSYSPVLQRVGVGGSALSDTQVSAFIETLLTRGSDLSAFEGQVITFPSSASLVELCGNPQVVLICDT